MRSFDLLVFVHHGRIVISSSEGKFCNKLYCRKRFKTLPMETKDKSDHQQVLSMFSHFEFSDCHLTSLQFKTIFMSPKLSSLKLVHTNFEMFPSDSLTLLTINYVNLSLETIKNLIQLKKLKKLHLLSTKIDCESIDFIINGPLKLESLSISERKLSQRNFMIIFNPHNQSSLKDLNIRSYYSNEVFNFDIDTTKFPYLTTLYIYAILHCSVIEKIFNNRLELTLLKIINPSRNYEIDFSRAHPMPSLRSFYYSESINVNIIDQILNKDMEQLTIGHLDAKSSLTLLRLLCGKCNNIISLALWRGQLMTACGKYIYNLKHLTQLDLSFCKTQPEICKYIFAMKSLTHIDLSDCEIGDEGLKYFSHHNLDNIHVSKT